MLFGILWIYFTNHFIKSTEIIICRKPRPFICKDIMSFYIFLKFRLMFWFYFDLFTNASCLLANNLHIIIFWVIIYNYRSYIPIPYYAIETMHCLNWVIIKSLKVFDMMNKVICIYLYSITI